MAKLTRIQICLFLVASADSQCDSRESIRANHSQLKPLFLQCVRPIRTNPSNFRFARITPLSACFYRVRAPDWQKWRSWREIDEKLAVRRSPPHWCKLKLSGQSLAEVRDALAFCFFPILLPQVLRAEGGHSDDLRERHHVSAKKSFGGTHVYKGMVRQKPGLGIPDLADF